MSNVQFACVGVAVLSIFGLMIFGIVNNIKEDMKEKKRNV